MSATAAQVAHYAQMAAEASLDALIDAGRSYRQQQIAQQREQAARIAGLTWLDVACAIRALGMPQASEDAVRVVRALSHVITETGYENSEECLQLLGFVGELLEELRLPPPLDPEQQRAADIEYRREADADARRQGFL